MSFFRVVAFAAVAGVILGAAAVALYVIRATPVHARVHPPAALARLAPTAPPRAVPAIAFTDETGRTLTLEKFRGRFVLVNLWASWCAPCVRELPALARLQAAVPASQLTIVAINVGRASEAESRAFLVGHDAKALAAYTDSARALLRTFETAALPLSILVDPLGRETARVLGPAQWDAPEAIAYLRAVTTPTSSKQPPA